jgi:hypothetical protein
MELTVNVPFTMVLPVPVKLPLSVKLHPAAIFSMPALVIEALLML